MERRLERLPRFHGGAAAEADAAAALQEELAASDVQLERLTQQAAAPTTPPSTPMAAAAEAAEAPATAEAPRRPQRWTPALNAAVVSALGPALTGKIGASVSVSRPPLRRASGTMTRERALLTRTSAPPLRAAPAPPSSLPTTPPTQSRPWAAG